MPTLTDGEREILAGLNEPDLDGPVMTEEEELALLAQLDLEREHAAHALTDCRPSPLVTVEPWQDGDPLPF